MRERLLFLLFLLIFQFSTVKSESTTEQTIIEESEGSVIQNLESFVLPENCSMVDIEKRVTTDCESLESVLCNCSYQTSPLNVLSSSSKTSITTEQATSPAVKTSTITSSARTESSTTSQMSSTMSQNNVSPTQRTESTSEETTSSESKTSEKKTTNKQSSTSENSSIKTTESTVIYASSSSDTSFSPISSIKITEDIISFSSTTESSFSSESLTSKTTDSEEDSSSKKDYETTTVPSTTTTNSLSFFDEEVSDDSEIIFLFNDYWMDESEALMSTTANPPIEIIDVTAIITYSTESSSITPKSPGGGQIIDVENRITYSTPSESDKSSFSPEKTTKQSGEIVDVGNVITYSTPSHNEKSVTTRSVGSDLKTTSGSGTTQKGVNIVDVSQVISHSTMVNKNSSSFTSTSFSSLQSDYTSSTIFSNQTSSTKSFDPSDSTSTAPWTEHAKAADSISSTISHSDSISSSTGKQSDNSQISSSSQSSSSSSSSSFSNRSEITMNPITTTINPSCSIQCPDGYIAGSSLCFLISDLSNIKSYQSALSFCQTVNLRNLISLEHLRNFNDLQLLKSKVDSLQTTSFYFANGGGSIQERIEKQAQVFNINMLTAMTSPIEMTVGISDSTSNISAICVLPQYCNVSQCYVESALNVLELNTILSTSKETIDSSSTTSITCSYTKSVTTITCGTRGNMMPNPTTISCEASGSSQKLRNTTSQLVSDCSMCLSRGTESCTKGNDENGNTGYTCNCKNEYSMSTCWLTTDSCTSETCNGHGKCSDTLGNLKCDCDWGYEGDSCEINKDRVTNTTDGFFTRLGNYIIDFPTIYALQTNTWTFLTIFAKSMGKIYVSNGEDDPQETHQAARAFFMTLGTSCVLFFNDPYLFKLSQATCRMFFILIHFCFMGAMIQWMLEGYNANQVVRCIHLNEWEKDFKCRRTWGIKAAPRLVIPLGLMAFTLGVVFQSNWYSLPSTWTCVGVICNQTTSVWLSAIWIVLCLVLTTAAFAESSVLLKHRRPLYNLKIRQRIERNIGVIDGWVAEKCRRNTVLCFIGVSLLSLTWLFTILASDKRSKYIFGWGLTLVSTVYGFFSFIQGMYTDPNCWSSFLWFAMKRFPSRFAPSYDPISMWTREEIKEIQKLPKEQQSILKEQMLPLNKRLFLSHKWDLMLNQKMENGSEMTDALLEILRNEMKRHHDLSGTEFQKQQLQETFAEFVKSVSERPPRIDLLGVNARSEAVTLCAEKEDGTAKLTKFMLIPDIDVFEPEEYYEEINDINEKRMNNEFDKETYKIAREEAVSQNKFMNSAIKFKYYGKIKA